MSEFTKGELDLEINPDCLPRIVDGDGNAICNMVADDPHDLENGKELIRRWNNFPKLKQQRDNLLAALVRYGEHEPGCIKGDACNCGLRAAIAKAKN